MKILIPPSEGKSNVNTGDINFEDTNFKFHNEVKSVLNILSNTPINKIEKIYGVTLEKSKIIHDDNINIFKNKCAPALARYTGVVYSNMNISEFNKKSMEYFEEKILITSAFLGLVSPGDMIPNYKLKMNVLGLTKFWEPIFTKHLESEDLIIDVLPKIHSEAYKAKNILKIDFKNYKKGKKFSAGHQGKVIKGKFLKFLVLNQVKKIEDILMFSEDSYKWDGEVFLREN
tara:strand:+ start:974 stop:1663 length:690 start_codon:yes stop_codon:yes gene_type:complete